MQARQPTDTDVAYTNLHSVKTSSPSFLVFVEPSVHRRGTGDNDHHLFRAVTTAVVGSVLGALFALATLFLSNGIARDLLASFAAITVFMTAYLCVLSILGHLAARPAAADPLSPV